MEFNTLALKDDFALTADESQEIDLHIDGIIEKHRQDSQELSRMALESASLITAVEARSNGMMSQGFFSRLWNTFTGNNHRLSASNQRDMARAQYLSQQMLNKLFEQNLVQFEMMVNMEHKVSILAQDILDTNQNLLQVCNVLSAFFKKQKKIKAEMAEFRRNDDLLFWKETIRDEEVFQDKPYSQLQQEQRVVCIANAFYTISKGHWNDRDLLFLKSVMREVGLEPDETVVPAHVLNAMSEDDALLKQFFRKTGYDLSALSPELADTPFSTCLAKLEMLEGEESYLLQTVCEFVSEASPSEVRLKMALKYIRQQTGRNLEKAMPCFDMVLDLITDLSMIPFFIVSTEPAAVEKIEVAEPEDVKASENDTEENDTGHSESVEFQEVLKWRQPQQQIYSKGGIDTEVKVLCMSPDGKTLFGANSDGINLWDVDTCEHIGVLGNSGINALCITPDGELLFSGDYSDLRIWNLKTRKEQMKKFRVDHLSSASALCLKPDGKTLFTAGGREEGEDICILDIETRKQIGTIEKSHRRDPSYITPDCKTLFCIKESHRFVSYNIEAWDVEDRERITTFETEYSDSLCLTPDGKTLFCGRWKSIRIWDIENFEEIEILEEEDHDIKALSVTPDGKTLFCGGSKKISIWDVETREILNVIPSQGDLLCLTPDGQTLISAGSDGIKFW